MLPALALLRIGLASLVPTLDFLATLVKPLSKTCEQGITGRLRKIYHWLVLVFWTRSGYTTSCPPSLALLNSHPSAPALALGLRPTPCSERITQSQSLSLPQLKVLEGDVNIFDTGHFFGDRDYYHFHPKFLLYSIHIEKSTSQN